MEAQLKECSFSPSLSNKSRKIVEQKLKLKTEELALRNDEEYTGMDKVRTVY